MSRLLLMLCLLPSAALACEVEVRNGTGIDVSIPVTQSRTLQLAPGDSGRFELKKSLWLDIGMIAYEYEIDAVRSALCTSGADVPMRIIIQSDGVIQRDVPGEQPIGFPLQPIGIHDLTGIPSGNRPQSSSWTG